MMNQTGSLSRLDIVSKAARTESEATTRLDGSALASPSSNGGVFEA